MYNTQNINHVPRALASFADVIRVSHATLPSPNDVFKGGYQSLRSSERNAGSGDEIDKTYPDTFTFTGIPAEKSAPLYMVNVTM
jgi:hypothetical protein